MQADEPTALIFDVYGRFKLEVRRRGDAWAIYRRGLGVNPEMTDIVIPSDLIENEIAQFLDDVFHELARPGERVRRVDRSDGIDPTK